MKIYIITAFWLVLALLTSALFVPISLSIGYNEVNDNIGKAENDLGRAFTLVAEAERKGANGSQLLNELDKANDLLLRAGSALRAGDYDTANSLATGCIDIAKNVVVEATDLKVNAEKAFSDKQFFTVIASVIGLALLLVFGTLGWRLLKKAVFKRTLGMRIRSGDTH